MDVSILHAGRQQPRHRDNLGIRAYQIGQFGADRNDAFALHGHVGTLGAGR
jgi:hypothetical protein